MTVTSVGDTGRAIVPPKAKKVEPESVEISEDNLPSIPETRGEYAEVYYRPLILPKVVIDELFIERAIEEEIDNLPVNRIVRENGEMIREITPLEIELRKLIEFLPVDR